MYNLGRMNAKAKYVMKGTYVEMKYVIKLGGNMF